MIGNRLMYVAWRLVLLAAVVPWNSVSAADQATVAAGQRDRAIMTLRLVMEHESGFVKVHAAEALLELDAPQGVQRVFLAEAEAHGDQPMYRLGVWRVLARCSAEPDERRPWIDKLRSVAFDRGAADRIGAIESLAKLKYRIPSEERAAFDGAAASDDAGLALFARWALAVSEFGDQQDAVASFLSSADPVTRLRAAFILRHLPNLSADNRQLLKDAARAEPPDTATYAYMTSSSFLVAEAYGDVEEAARCRAELLRIAQTREPGERQEACRAFAERGTQNDLPWLRELLHGAAPGVRVAAALTCARIEASAERSAAP